MLQEDVDEDGFALLEQQPTAETYDTTAWRSAHALCFIIGGTTFIAGTAVLYVTLALHSALLYIVGSIAFLSVDLLELYAYRASPTALRLNISLSASGSALYVAGSVGYLPSVAGDAPAPVLGLSGFIAGSTFIFLSQIWKLVRLAEGPGGGGGGGCGGASLRALFFDASATSAALVELGACAGAFCFLAGSVPLAIAPSSAVANATALALWMAGSVAFTCGACALTYRHAVQRL